MFKIKTLNQISENGLKNLPEDTFVHGGDIAEPDGILVRSANMHGMDLPESLLAIARAGAGTNNIPIDECSRKGIVVFNTPGANANAVKELTIAGLLMASRKIAQGIQWTCGLDGDVTEKVEKGKKAYIGPEIYGKCLGIIGLGAIGVLVANAAIDLGMEVIGYDPFLQIESAWHLSRRAELAADLDELIRKSDYITIHVPANKSTEKMINAEFIAKCKDGVRIVNFARGELVDVAAMKDALECGKVSSYVCDFPDTALMHMPNVVMTPHLGASTPESEENCAVMAVAELSDYLLHGNIVHSVNFPDCSIPYTGKSRVATVHRNIPNMIGSVTTVFAKEGINIDNMINKSRGDWAYTLIDVDDLHGKGNIIVKNLEDVEGIVRVRIIKEE